MTTIPYVEDIPASLSGERLDRTVALIADVSRSEAHALVADGKVRVNGAVIQKPSTRLDTGSVVEFAVTVHQGGPRPDPSIEFPVVYEDDQVLVVDKPAGLVMHHGSGVSGGTLVDGLIARYPEIRTVGPTERPGLVHRLDKGTSGLLMVARTDQALEYLSEQLQTRIAGRHYLALLWGDVESKFGVVDAPLGRSGRDATKRAVVANGKVAQTSYEVLDRFVPEPNLPALVVSLVRCSLATGRTHQIRVHMASIGHPVVGDATYGGAIDRLDSAALRSQQVDRRHIPKWVCPSRPMLHAGELTFFHPSDDREMAFASEVPDDFARLLARLSEGGRVEDVE